jgi:hypothetical protein
MDSEIFTRGFKLVEYIYDNPDKLDLRRIKEVGNGLGPKHWIGKQWLVDNLIDHVFMEDIHVAAGWLGLTSYLLRKEFPDNSITNSDIDSGCMTLGEYLFTGYNIKFEIRDTVLNVPDCGVYINTSIEHIPQKYVEHILKYLKQGTIVALQSNNYYSVEDHVNCSKDINEFIHKTNLKEIYYTGEIPFENHDRYMIIGKV